MNPEKKQFKSNERFEDGLLRTDACMARHSMPRNSQYRTSSEDLPEQAFGLSAVREERRLMNDVYKLISKGLKPKGPESLESFVEKHSDLLDEGGGF